MITGPEAYRKACDLAEAVEDGTRTDVVLPLAQVYATLALAAATAADRWISPVRDHGGHDVHTIGDGWVDVVKPPVV